MQIDSGTIVVPIVGGVTNIDDSEMQIDPGTVAPLATSTVPCGLEVKSLN
jgi:hypothetical protein